MKPTVYIAGKLNDMACDYIKNVHIMIKNAKKVRDIGGAVYVPCIDLLEGIVSGNMDYPDYFDNSQPFLAKCDAVFVGENWATSKGTIREIEFAISLDKPIFFDLEILQKWIENYAVS